MTMAAKKKRKTKRRKKAPKNLSPKSKAIVLKKLNSAWNRFGRKEYVETGMSDKEFAEDAGRFIDGMEDSRLVKL